MAETASNNVVSSGEVETFSLQEFMQACLKKWLWFAVSLVVCVGLGVLYVLRKEPVYERYEQILIKDQDSGGGIGAVPSTFAALGLFSSNSSVNNELISITSPAILAEVIDRLHLEMNYATREGLHPVTLFGSSLPIEVRLLDIDSQGSGSFKCDLNPDGTATLYKFVKGVPGGKLKFDDEIKTKLGATINTPLGKVYFGANPAYEGAPLEETMKINVAKGGLQSTIENYSTRLQGDLVDEYAEVIELTIKDPNVERAVAILNEVVAVYNQNYVDDKNRIAKATSDFIDDRLSVIERELGNVDSNIAKYRSSTGSINLYAEGMALMEKDQEYEEKIVQLNTSIELTKMMQSYLNDKSHQNTVIPNNTGLQSQEIEVQIAKYNDLLLARNTLVSSSSESNPLVKDYDQQLDALRAAISKGFANQLTQLQTNLASARKEQAKAKGTISSAPEKTLPLLSEQRQQQVKENLYLFLLEKREENELSQKFTADNTRVITPPMGSLKPISPKKNLILAFAFILGLAIPACAVYMKVTGDTKVRARKDLDGISMPFAGEIPQVGKARLKNNASSKKKVKLKDEKAPMAVVEEGKRDVVNEAFRVIRSNMEFMSKGTERCQVVMLTSFNPGSGKSFISYNLGLSFALKKKRVLLIDCDLRHGSTSMYVGMPGKGITDYLSGATDDWRKFTIPSPADSNLSILPVGKMPPNPAELLENGRLEEIISQAKADYDYIFLDCPPVNVVVDTQIVGKYADSTLFVVRAGLLEKSALAELNEFYKERKFNHMSLILNGTDESHSRYYTYGNYQHY
jgi:capsular exopolysaccharide synthesis family protein